MNKVDVIGVVTELHEQIGWALQALKQNEPPSCGPVTAPVGASVENILARTNIIERELRQLEWRFKALEDCANDGPSVCPGHATLKTIVASHWDHISKLQAGMVERRHDHDDVSSLKGLVDSITRRLNVIENILHSKSAPPPEPSVPVSELRELERDGIESTVGGSWKALSVDLAKWKALIAKAEGGAK